MKKLLLFSAALLFIGSTFAQDKRMWLSGNVGFGSGKSGNTDNFNWSVSPEFGFMLNEAMAIGINVGVNGRSADNTNTKIKNTWTDMRFTPFFRYYLGDNDKFKFFGQANVYFAFGNQKNEDNSGATGVTTETKYDGFGINVRPGIQYWFTDSWSMLATFGELGYSGQTNNKGLNSESKDSNFGLNVNLSTITYGLIFHF